MKKVFYLVGIFSLSMFRPANAGAQNVGIGTKTPTAPLSFGPANNAYSQQMVFYKNDQNTYPEAGLGTEGTNMVFSMAAYSNSIAFGYGRSEAFNETMRIQGVGNVGIGVKDPQHRLDVNGRMRIRWQSGLLPSPPGFQVRMMFAPWQYANYFLGMMNDFSVGMMSEGKTVFRYSAFHGALSFNDTDGFAGQVLVSNGPNATASWQYMTNIYDYTTDFFDPTAYSLSDKAPAVEMTAFTRVVGLPRISKVSVDYSIPVSTASCAFCGPTDFVVQVKLNGTIVHQKQFNLLNARINTVSGSTILEMNNGNTVSIVVVKTSGPTLTIPAVAGRLANMVLWAIPQL